MMATDKQVAFCRTLFRKVKMYYNCCEDDDHLRDEVLNRTGFDLDNLTQEDAQKIIGKLKPVLKNRRYHRPY